MGVPLGDLERHGVEVVQSNFVRKGRELVNVHEMKMMCRRKVRIVILYQLTMHCDDEV